MNDHPIFGDRLVKCHECHGSYRQSSLDYRGVCADCQDDREAYSRLLHDELEEEAEQETLRRDKIRQLKRDWYEAIRPTLVAKGEVGEEF